MYTNQFAKERFSPQEQWLKENILLETIVGSYAYGCQTDESDYDIVSIVMNLHPQLYPQSYGYILGFDQIPKFENKECKDKNNIILPNGKECEGAWHTLTNYFYLVANGSPNLTEVLFTRSNFVTYGHKIGHMLRDNRQKFLSMRMFHSFKGYSYSQLSRAKKEMHRWQTEHKCDNSNRETLYTKFGYDTKMAMHTLRLLDLVHQLLTDGDLDLMRNREELKAMRQGLWGSWEKFESHVEQKIKELESLSLTSNAVANKPQMGVLHELLLNCIEEWYGKVGDIQKTNEYVSAKEVMDKLTNIERLLNNVK